MVYRDNSYLTDILSLLAALGAACHGSCSYFLRQHRSTLSSVNTANGRFLSQRGTGYRDMFQTTEIIPRERCRPSRFWKYKRDVEYMNAWSVRILSRGECISIRYLVDVSSIPSSQRSIGRRSIWSVYVDGWQISAKKA